MTNQLRRLRMDALEQRDVPAGDLAYALQLNGLGNSATLRIAADNVGNSYVVGTFSGTIDVDPTATVTPLTSAGGTDVFVAKYSQTGALQWAKAVGGSDDDKASDVTFDGAGNVYLSGTFRGTADFDPGALPGTMTAAAGGSAFVWKLDVSGNLVFARMVEGTSTANSLTIDSRGNILVTGNYQGSADFNPSASITRLTTTNTNGAAYLWKLDNIGAMLFAKDISGSGTIAPTSVNLDGAGNVYVGGHFTGAIDFDPTAIANILDGGANTSPFVAKYNTYGNLSWAKAATGGAAVTGATNSVVGIEFDSAGNVYAAGTYAGTVDFNPDPLLTAALTSTSNSVDGFVWKLDTTGNYVWAKSFGGANNDTVGDFSVDQAGNTYTVGTFTGTGDFDPNAGTVNLVGGTGTTGYVVKLTPTGNLGYARWLGGTSSTVTPSGVWGDGAGNIYIAGAFTGASDFEPGTDTTKLTSETTGSGFIVKLAPGSNPNPAPPTGTTNPNPNPDPNVELTATTSGPYVINEGQGLSVKANVTYTGTRPLTYSWDLNGNGVFGDYTGKSFTLTPSQMRSLGLNDSRPNPITVKVRVSDGVNPPVIATTTLTINNVGPKARVTGPTSAKQGETIQLGYTAPGEQSWADYYAGYRYSFDFNNDGTWDRGNGKYGGSGTNASPIIPASFVTGSGTMTVRARVIDKDNGFTETTLTINIINIAPTADFRLLTNAFVGVPSTFAFLNAKDPSAVDVQQGLIYAYDFNGDGNFETVTPNAQMNYTFQFSGVQIVRGRVYDMHGAFTDYSLTINVQ